MTLVPGGAFRMGGTGFYAEERPVITAEVQSLWVDDHPVTNAAFRRFAADTGHVTVAEISPDPGDFPGTDPALLVPGSQVFTPTPGPVPLDVDRPGNLGGSDSWEDAGPWRHSGSTPTSCASAR
jgi:formylglycine-generating enzyme